MEKGKLHLIPVPLSGSSVDQLAATVITQARKLNYFLAENAKSARHFIKSIEHPLRLADIEVREMDRDMNKEDIDWLSKICKKGIDVGIVSEAGLPCVADPGKEMVAFAHQNGIEVISYPGPNSMMMALMASGLNGQEFSFLGYLPRKKEELREKLIQIGKLSAQKNTSYIFMETPYRNKALIDIAISVLPSELFLSISTSLGTEKQKSITKKISAWKLENLNFLLDVPAVFVLSRK